MIRLYSEQKLEIRAILTLDKAASHYLINVMRLKTLAQIHIFNHIDGEWLATLISADKKSCQLQLERQIRLGQISDDLWLIFAPIRPHRQSFLTEKATELGVNSLVPTVFEHSEYKNFNVDKAKLIAIQAIEQSEQLAIPIIKPIQKLKNLLESWPKERLLIWCSEHEVNTSFAKLNLEQNAKYAILIGPEGGFSNKEVALLKSYDFVRSTHLGPNILRAETASIAAITLYNFLSNKWFSQPKISE